MFIFALVVIAAGIFLFRLHHTMPSGKTSFLLGTASRLVALLGVLLLVFSCIVVIPAGNVGVSVVFGRVGQRVLGNGIQFKNPLAHIEKMSVRAQTYTMSGTGREGEIAGDDAIYALSSDGMLMPLEVTSAYQLVGSDAAMVYEHLGTSYVEKILRPAIRASVRSATSHYTAQEAYSTKRDELQARMQEQIGTEMAQLLGNVADFEGKGFSIISVMLRNVDLPDKVKNAIEDKLEAQQQAEQMVYVLQKEKQEAERKRIEAEGIKAFQQTVSEGINENLLRWKGIEATRQLAESQNTKVIIVGSGKDGLPLILGTQ